jgi:hypothetical protein
MELEAGNIEEFENEILVRSTEISIAIVESVCEGVEKGIDKVIVGTFPKLELDIVVDIDGYLDALEMNIDKVEQAEMYELCSRAVKCIDILNDVQ